MEMLRPRASFSFRTAACHARGTVCGRGSLARRSPLRAQARPFDRQTIQHDANNAWTSLSALE